MLTPRWLPIPIAEPEKTLALIMKDGKIVKDALS